MSEECESEVNISNGIVKIGFRKTMAVDPDLMVMLEGISNLNTATTIINQSYGHRQI